jgi:hypothetical protein
MKRIIASSFVFIISMVSAFFFEEYFRKLIRYFYTFSTDNNISFIGKNFHLFASNLFVTGFGLYCVLLFNIVKKRKAINALIISSLFTITSFTISFYDSKSKIIVCTACDNGKLKINYNGIDYDFIFITSLLISILPFLLKSIRKYKAKKQ